LNLKRTYKTILAALLLALYAFIATPVSYWHQHNSNCNKNEKDEHSQIVKKSSLDSDENCKICTHHYSVASNDATTFYFSGLDFYSSYYTFLSINNITNPGYSKSNKGPPAIG